jgi:uncharacterized protein (TIGR02246 family)
MRKSTITALLLLAGLCSPAAAQSSAEEKFRAAVEAIQARIADGFNKHDAAAIAANYTADAVALNPRGLHKGRDALEKSYAALLATYVGGFDVPLDETHLIGETAGWSINHTSLIVKTPSGETRVQGLRSALYALDHGAWKVRMETIDTLPPPPATGGAK